MAKKNLKKILVLAVVVIMIFSLAACAPRGYISHSGGYVGPFKYSGSCGVPGNIAWQFPELNTPQEDGKMYFMFNDTLYHLRSTKDFRAVYSGDTLIGVLLEIPDEWQTIYRRVYGGISFIYENYLFFNFRRYRGSKFGLQDYSPQHSKQEFYRFNLNTGENEEIRLTQFVEALQKIDSNWEINPDYKGER